MKRRVRASEKTRKALAELFSGRGEGGKSHLVKLATRLIVEEALEGEVRDQLGREYCAHGAQAGHCNGYRRGRLDTGEGRIGFAVPQALGREQPYRSEIQRALAGGRTEELERLAIEMYARGLSVRDIERSFTDRRGECLLSKSAVSELGERLWADCQAFAERWRELKAMALAACQAASPMLAELAKDDFVRRFERELPSVTACFLEDFPACVAQLRLPIAHRRVIRTTNLLERLLGEERRRTKVIPHAFGERAVLKLMYAALIRASQNWRRIVISEFELKQIEKLKIDLDNEFKQRTASAVSSASRQRIYSKERT